MRVKIGKYTTWIGPFQIAEALCFWTKPVVDEHGFKSKPDWVHDFGTWLSGGKDGESTLLKVCQWIESKKRRQIYVKIDRWDTWSMDSTLSHIILPMLKQLKATQHGGPTVDDEDVPEGLGLRASEAAPKENEWDIDGNHFKRWAWVLDEMIQAFECKASDTWEDQYRSGVHDTEMVPCKWDEEGEPTLYEMKTGPNDTYKCDYDALRAHQVRNSNGFRLFGKYYEALWD
jgi:hypothetical protein